MRFLPTDLPIIQQALGVYIKAVQDQIPSSGVVDGSATGELLLDGLEQAKRLLARATAEISRTTRAPDLRSPTPGVSL